MLKIYDAQCSECQHIDEVWSKDREQTFRCSVCDSDSHIIITPVKFHLPGNDPAGFPGAAMKWAKDHQKNGNKP